MSSHASLSAAADDRKARLAKLKSLKRKEPEPSYEDDDQSYTTQQDSTSPHPPTQEVSHLHLSGRNYDPAVRGPKLGFEHAPTTNQETLEDKAAELEEEVRRKAAEEEQEGDKGIDLFKLQPKKPNWDLKRELAKKMEILNVRTENAIARLVRERLEKKKEEARQDGRPGDGEAEGEGVLEGTAMVEGLRMREREEEEEERREREEGDGL
jgi:coiled-coil domain-containing protein 12